MTLPKIEEPTLYPPIINYLNAIGIEAVGNTRLLGKEPDILFKLDSSDFVIEVKFDDEKVTKAMGQAFKYARRLKTNNVIILMYPARLRNQTILDYKNIDKIATETKITALILTEYWTDEVETPLEYIFTTLKNRFAIKERIINFNSVVKLIGKNVEELHSLITLTKKSELYEEVVSRLDLFESIGEIKDKKKAENQVNNLASYLLFNQLLFYHIYKRKTGEKDLPELEHINEIKDVQKYFDAITHIDYLSIYRVNILGHLPNEKLVIDTINEVISSIKLLRVEHITHDLAGRFFHDLIPYEVRKVLAAFYTHPISADILAGLTIDSWDETVTDPSCGSGTLLVASYRRKQEIYQKLYGFQDLNKMHKKFIENDLTGIDIMPFAAHLTTINLTTQNIEQKTNIVRIATKDSLDLAELLKTKNFNQSGIKITPYTETIQQTLSGAIGQKIKKSGAISPEGKGGEFYLKPVDVVIMNPPFTDREKMPNEMREKLKNSSLGNVCGHQINLWGYFLVLSDLLLKQNGKIGAVIPINIARGKATEKIKDFLLENYQIEYIVKPIGDIAFSEGAAFRDILFIGRKSKPKENDVTKIIFLKKSIKNSDKDDVDKIVKKIKSIKMKENEIYIDDFFEMWCVYSNYLIQNKENLMSFLRGNSAKTRKIFLDFFDMVGKKSKNQLRTLNYNEMSEGFHASPEGLSELVFVTNPIKNSRISRNVIMILDKEDDRNIYAKINIDKKDEEDIGKIGINRNFKLSKNLVKPALKTITSITNLDISKKHDYIITDNFQEFEKILLLSKWKGKFKWDLVRKNLKDRSSFFAIQHRIRINSPNTNVIGIYSDTPFYTTHAFTIFKTGKDESKILTLFCNSIFGLCQLSSFSKETTEGYMEFMQSDLVNMKVLNFKKIEKSDINKLLNLFEKIRNTDFPSIMEQLENRFKTRVELDKTIFKILGFTDKETEEWLPKLYDMLVQELKFFTS